MPLNATHIAHWLGKNGFARLLLALGLLLSTIGCGEEGLEMRNDSLSSFLPREVQGWRQTGIAEQYDRQTIFDYIDGAGEVYLQFGFQDCLVQRYRQGDNDSLMVELFDMGSAEDAFGIFSYIREEPDIGIGQGSQRVGSVLHFWQDRYFVSIYPETPNESNKAAALELGRAIAALIGTDGALPKIISLLPPENLDGLSVRFFHQHASLNYHYYLASENLLHLSESTDAVMASYKDLSLVIVEYASADRAAAALSSFCSEYLDTDKPDPVELEDEKWASAATRNHYLIAVFDTPSAAVAERITEQVEAAIERQASSQETE